MAPTNATKPLWWVALGVAGAACIAGCSAQAVGGEGRGDAGADAGRDASTDGDTSGPESGSDSGTSMETCDGLDNDGDGAVDEDCGCADGASQPCYPRPHEPADGCRRGEQTCGSSGRWGECSGATVPAAGEADCCALPDDPDHTLYESFLATYPAADMPKSVDGIRDFAPEADGHVMRWSEVNPGDELVDPDSGGGVVEASIEMGRAMSRDAAEETIPATGEIVDVLEGPVTIEDLGGSGTCSGVGWAWGSILYRTEDDAVSELIYLYIGYCCCSEADNDDIEAFYFSEEPSELCAGPMLI